MSLAQRIVGVLLQEEDFDLSPEEMRKMVRPNLATFAPMFQRHNIAHHHVQQWNTTVESDTKDLYAFVSILERAEGDIKEPSEFIRDYQGTTVTLEISLMGRQGAEHLPAERMKWLKVLKAYPENRADVVDLVKDFVGKTLPEHLNGHRGPDGHYDWKAVIDGIQYALSDLVEATANAVPRHRANPYREWRSRILHGESMGDEDVRGFVDAALGFGAVLPRNVPKRDVHFDHFTRQYDIGDNLGRITVSAYHKFYKNNPNAAMFKAHLRPPFGVGDEEFDVEVDMSKGASAIIDIARRFIANVEALKQKYEDVGYGFSNGKRLKDEVALLFYKTVEELKPYTIFVKI